VVIILLRRRSAVLWWVIRVAHDLLTIVSANQRSEGQDWVRIASRRRAERLAAAVPPTATDASPTRRRVAADANLTARTGDGYETTGGMAGS
jgi:hypothetical protein